MKIVVQLPLVAEFLPDQMAAVGGGIDQHIARPLPKTALQNSLQIFILQLIFLKRKVIHIDNELVIPILDLLQHIGKRLKLVLVYFDHAQAPAVVFVENRLDAGGFSCSRITEEKHVVGRFPVYKGLCILNQLLFLQLIAYDILKINVLHIDNGINDGLCALLFFKDPKSLVETEFAGSALPVKFHHMVLEGLCVLCLPQHHRQLYQAIPDPAVENTAFLNRRAVVCQLFPHKRGG